MPAKAPVSKQKKSQAIAAASGAKAKKKKWSKGKVRDKLNNMVRILSFFLRQIDIFLCQVLFDKATYDKCIKDLPQYKLITPAIVCERFKVRGSLARSVIRELVRRGLIRSVVKHSKQEIYTRSTKEDAPGDQDTAKESATDKKETGGGKRGGKKIGKAEAAADIMVE